MYVYIYFSNYLLWKISPTRSNWYSSKFVILFHEERRSQFGHFRQSSDMLLLVLYQFFWIRLWISDICIEIVKIRFAYLPHIVRIVSMFASFRLLVRLLVGCRYLQRRISKQRFLFLLDSFLLRRNISF